MGAGERVVRRSSSCYPEECECDVMGESDGGDFFRFVFCETWRALKVFHFFFFLFREK